MSLTDFTKTELLTLLVLIQGEELRVDELIFSNNTSTTDPRSCYKQGLQAINKKVNLQLHYSKEENRWNWANTHIVTTMITAIKAFCDAGHKLKSITVKVDTMNVNFSGKARIVFVIADHVGKTACDQRKLHALMRYTFPHTRVYYDVNAMEGG